MLRLIINENMKIYRRFRTWILLILLVVISVGASVAYKIETQHSTIGWRSETRAAIQTYENRLKDTSINEMLRREAQNKLSVLQIYKAL